MEGVLAELGAEIEGLEEVRRIFLDPAVEPVRELVWKTADPDGVKRMLCDEFDFSPDRIDKALASCEVARKAASQASLDLYSDTR